jgi:hypothetical protein
MGYKAIELITDFHNKHMKLSKVLFFLIIALRITVAAESQKKYELIYPQTSFDSASAASLLDEKGNAIIKGRALLNNKPMGYNAEVSLFPVTPHLKEYLQLEKQFGVKGRKRAALSPVALSYRIITRINSLGEFEFSNLKPGNYYLECFVIQSKEKRGALFEGQDYFTWEGGIIAGPLIFSEYTYYKQKAKYLSGFVTVSKEGETVTAEIRN